MPSNYFADQDDRMQERAYREAPPSDEDRMVAAMKGFVRRANITASPPAHLEPTVWSTPIDITARVTVPAAVGIYVTALTYTVPEGRAARIQKYGVNVIDPAYTYNGSILWQFVINGQPMPDGMADWAQQRGSVVSPRDTFIILKERDVITLQVRRAVVAGAPQDVEHALIGYTWRPRNSLEGTALSVTAW